MEETSQHPLPARFRKSRASSASRCRCFFFCVFFLFSDPSPMKFIGDPPSTRNWTGIVGSYTAGWMIFFWASPRFFCRPLRLRWRFPIFPASGVFPEDASRVRLPVCDALARRAFRRPDPGRRHGVRATFPSGGILGAGLVRFLQGYFNPAGTFILLIAWMMVSLFFIIDFSLVSTTEKFLQSVREGLSAFQRPGRLLLHRLVRQGKSRKKSAARHRRRRGESPAEKSKNEKSRADPFDFAKLQSDGAFQLPPFSLLSEPPQTPASNATI